MMEHVVMAGTVSRVAFGYGVELVVSGALVRIEGDAAVRRSDTRTMAFDAEAPGDATEALLCFLYTDVKVEVAGSTLFVRAVVSDCWIEVPPSSEYEAWSVVMADGSRFICGVGGEVSRWTAS